MPRRWKRPYRRNRRRNYGRRKRPRQAVTRRGGYTRGGKFNKLRITKPIKLKLPFAGFPNIVHTKLRLSFDTIMDPSANPDPTLAGASLLNIRTNGLVAPMRTDVLPTGSSQCYLHLDDYARMYSNYRVQSSRIVCRVLPYLTQKDSTPPVLCETYFTILVNNQGLNTHGTPYPGNVEAAKTVNDIDSMRAAGHRFLKVDPRVMYTGPSAIGFRQGNPNSQYATRSWSQKYIAKDVNDEDQVCLCNTNPKYTGYFTLVALQPSNPIEGQTRDPCPINIQITLEANVTFWRRKSLQAQPTWDEINAILPTHAPDPLS